MQKLKKNVSGDKVSLLDMRFSLIPKATSNSSTRVKTAAALVSVGNNFPEQRQRQLNRRKTHKRALLGLPVHPDALEHMNSKNFKHICSRYNRKFASWKKEADSKSMSPEEIDKLYQLFLNGDPKMKTISGLPVNANEKSVNDLVIIDRQGG